VLDSVEGQEDPIELNLNKYKKFTKNSVGATRELPIIPKQKINMSKY
jgi:hypothetical protein